jgi:hypothetical protein
MSIAVAFFASMNWLPSFQQMFSGNWLSVAQLLIFAVVFGGITEMTAKYSN